MRQFRKHDREPYFGHGNTFDRGLPVCATGEHREWGSMVRERESMMRERKSMMRERKSMVRERALCKREGRVSLAREGEKGEEQKEVDYGKEG